jgi:hypothetical protein
MRRSRRFLAIGTGFERFRVETGPIHRGREIHRRGNEVLHLTGAIAVPFQEEREFDHRREVGARMRGDEVGDEVLLLARLGGGFLEGFREGLEVLAIRLLHPLQNAVVDVLGRHFEMAAHVVAREFFEVFGAEASEVHAHPARDVDFLHAVGVAHLAHEVDDRAVVGSEQLADGREDARKSATDGLDFRLRDFMPYMFAVGPPRSEIVPL